MLCVKTHVQFVHSMVMKLYILILKITSWMITSAVSDTKYLRLGLVKNSGFASHTTESVFLKNQSVIAIAINM